MEELERLKRKIKNARDLQSVVKIMKTISASNIREYELAVESLGEYNKTIEMGFQIVMRNKPRELLAVRPVGKKKRLGAVVFGSDQGLCGSFNEQIASYAVKKMNEIKSQERTSPGHRRARRLPSRRSRTANRGAFFLWRPSRHYRGYAGRAGQDRGVAN